MNNITGGKIVGTTKGTPLNPPQVVERGFTVPVYLLDTTLDNYNENQNLWARM